LLAFCLAVSAILHFASQSYPRHSEAPGQLPGISAPDAAAALVVGNKIENPFSAELQTAAFSRVDCLRIFGGDCGLLPSTNGKTLPSSVASAIEIRGPPQSSQS
jgi:hypothetical protein